MTPTEFIEKWGPRGPAYTLNEEQGAQSYFIDLCELLEVPKPGMKRDLIQEQSKFINQAPQNLRDEIRTLIEEGEIWCDGNESASDEKPAFLDDEGPSDVLPTHITKVNIRELFGWIPGETLSEALARNKES